VQRAGAHAAHSAPGRRLAASSYSQPAPLHVHPVAARQCTAAFHSPCPIITAPPPPPPLPGKGTYKYSCDPINADPETRTYSWKGVSPKETFTNAKGQTLSYYMDSQKRRT
jgi:hypothetical protein